jgi:hypothetical protein
MTFLQPDRTEKPGMGSLIPAMIVVACFVAITGCGEPTGPRTICCVSQPQPEQTVMDLAVLAGELHDAADVFAQGVTDPALRGKAESAVNHLADQFLAGKVASSRTAIAQARSLLATLNDVPAIELAPVGLAVDYVERRMNEILIAGGYGG